MCTHIKLLIKQNAQKHFIPRNIKNNQSQRAITPSPQVKLKWKSIIKNVDKYKNQKKKKNDDNIAQHQFLLDVGQYYISSISSWHKYETW